MAAASGAPALAQDQAAQPPEAAAPAKAEEKAQDAKPPVEDKAATLFDMMKIPPLAEIPLPDIATFKAETRVFEEHPEPEEVLSYRIRLPKGWSQSTSGGVDEDIGERGRRILSELARYYGPPALNARSMVYVTSVELVEPISIRNWFLNYLISNGYAIRGIDERSPNRVEALYVVNESDLTYVVRTVAQLNGNQIIMSMYYLPATEWEKESSMQAMCSLSFQVLNIQDDYKEALETFTFLDLLEFDYPSSWEMRAPNFKDIERMSTLIVHTGPENMNYGWIEVYIVAKTANETSIPKEVEELKLRMEEKDISFGRLISQIEGYKFPPDVEFSRIEAYEGYSPKRKVVDYEIWAGVITTKDYYYYVTMATPSRRSDLYNWSINTEVFEQVAVSIRPWTDPELQSEKKTEADETDAETGAAQEE